MKYYMLFMTIGLLTGLLILIFFAPKKYPQTVEPPQQSICTLLEVVCCDVEYDPICYPELENVEGV